MTERLAMIHALLKLAKTNREAFDTFPKHDELWRLGLVGIDPLGEPKPMVGLAEAGVELLALLDAALPGKEE